MLLNAHMNINECTITQVLDTQGYMHYIHYTLIVVPNTEAALPCCSAIDTYYYYFNYYNNNNTPFVVTADGALGLEAKTLICHLAEKIAAMWHKSYTQRFGGLNTYRRKSCISCC